MDSNLAWYKMLQDQGKIFASANTPVSGMLGEAPRFSYPSGWNMEMLLYAAFPHFSAYVLNKFLIYSAGFYSMLLLLHRLFPKKEAPYFIIGMALIWATLAFYPHRGIGIAALPAVYLAFLWLKSKVKFGSALLILIFYGFYSTLSLTGLYFLLALLIWFARICYSKKKLSIPFLGGISLLALCYIIQDHQLLYALFLKSDFTSHRAGMTYDFGIWINKYPWEFLLSGDQNGVHYAPLFVMITAIFCFLLWRKKALEPFQKTLIWLILLISIVCSFFTFSGILGSIGKALPAINSINFLRFQYLIPFMLILLMIISWQQLRFKRDWILILGLLLVNIFVYQYEWRYMLNTHLRILDQKVPSYKAYFAEEQYDEIKTALGENWKTSKFAHVNLPPAVSAFNGLQALDGYVQLYDRDYQLQVYQVIKEELEKDEFLKKHFLNWGNKCYFQNASYPDDFHMYSWCDVDPITKLDFNFQYLKNQLKDDLILAGLEIHSDFLEKVHTFEHPNSAWKIYMYQIKDL